MVFLGICCVLGAIVGALTARRRGGRRVDLWHYGAIFAILFTLIGLFIDIFLGHMI